MLQRDIGGWEMLALKKSVWGCCWHCDMCGVVLENPELELSLSHLSTSGYKSSPY